MTKTRVSEAKKLLEEYKESYGQYRAKQGQVLSFFYHMGYTYFDVVTDYPDGILVSPRLLAHKDWEERTITIDSDRGDYEILDISQLTNLPEFVGDNDWNIGYDLIKL